MPDWVADTANILGIIGFIVSLFTYINTLLLRGKIVSANEKHVFFAKRDKLIREIEGFIKSIVKNDIYTVGLLGDIYLFMARFLKSFTFVNRRLRKEVEFVKNNIENYKNNILIESERIFADKNELIDKLTSISALLGKEVG